MYVRYDRTSFYYWLQWYGRLQYSTMVPTNLALLQQNKLKPARKTLNRSCSPLSSPSSSFYRRFPRQKHCDARYLHNLPFLFFFFFLTTTIIIIVISLLPQGSPPVASEQQQRATAALRLVGGTVGRAVDGAGGRAGGRDHHRSHYISYYPTRQKHSPR